MSIYGKTIVYAWGFKEPELELWPSDLQPILINQIGRHAVTVVHSRAIDEFVTAAQNQPKPDGSLATAVLYDAGERLLLGQSLLHFDAVVSAGQWNELREQVTCPQRFTMIEQAQELSAPYLATLQQPIENLATRSLPLSDSTRTHLDECPKCRAAFNDAVRLRLTWRRQLLCPSVAELEEYAVSRTINRQVAHHVEGCRACQAEVANLQRLKQRVWLGIPVPSQTHFPGQILDGIASSAAKTGKTMERWTETLGILIHSLLGARLVPTGARMRRRPAGMDSTGAIAFHLLQTLQSGDVVSFKRPQRDIDLRVDAETNCLTIGPLHGAERKTTERFAVEILAGETPLWRGESQEGELRLPLEDLETAIEDGADEIVILADDSADRN